MKAVVICSGGLDSVVLSHLLYTQGWILHLLSFDYGQRHRKELDFAKQCAERLGAEHDVVDLTTVPLGGSALTDRSIPVPDGHYEHESMKITVVPNRNAIMLSVAFGVAAANNAEMVAIGVHGGDHAIYPDCRLPFIQQFERMEESALDMDIRLATPFISFSKTEIVLIGNDLRVPFHETWSCYKGGDHHCGTCGTCMERREAFEKAYVPDPTIYEGVLNV